MGLRIMAVEPQPACLAYLKSKYGKRIHLVPKGLAADPGMLTLHVSPTHVLSSFSTEWISATKESGRFSSQEWNEQIEVPVDTLDNLIAQFGVPAFIKIDVEGFELEVLKGLSKPVRALSFEYTVPERNEALYNCIDWVLKIADSRKVEFNYSTGESMELAAKEWIPKDQIMDVLKSDAFISSGFGDIYVRMIDA
jgi:FkbM family methyltransferase